MVSLEKMVGMARFELTTTTPPVWCATRLRYIPTDLNKIRLFVQSAKDTVSKKKTKGYL